MSLSEAIYRVYVNAPKIKTGIVQTYADMGEYFLIQIWSTTLDYKHNIDILVQDKICKVVFDSLSYFDNDMGDIKVHLIQFGVVFLS